MAAHPLTADAGGGMVIDYAPRGAARMLFGARVPEVLLAGPAGTGKSRAILEKLHLIAAKYPGVRILIMRKTLQSLKSSTLVTFDEKVQPQLDGVTFKGDTAKRPAHYEYPNGSVIVIGGMDKPTKVLSSEYDVIYVAECTELNEGEWETLSMRLRNGKMPYQQLIGDCNPDAPTHWLRVRVASGKTTELLSVHEDNPLLWDARNECWTREGARYIAVLDSLTGVRKARYRYGQWAAAEGLVYEDSWQRDRNLIDRATISSRPSDPYGDCGIPPEWPRYLVIDFGYTHPFVCQWYAVDPDGRLYRYREIYMTHRLVTDHAQTIMHYSRWGKEHGDSMPRAIITDHDAEDRATLERELALINIPAHKGVSDGIQAVANRWRPAGDGRPRLFLLRDSLIERDPYLTEAKLPACTEEEIESYVWDTRKEAPVKENDHGMDTTRYMVAERDVNAAGNVQYFEVPF